MKNTNIDKLGDIGKGKLPIGTPDVAKMGDKRKTNTYPAVILGRLWLYNQSLRDI